MISSRVRRLTILFAVVICGTMSTGTFSFAGEIHSLMTDAAKRARSEDFRKALELYNEVLRREPGNLEALNGKARVLSWMGEFREAAAVCNTVLSKNPKDFDATLCLADISAWEKNYEKGICILTTFLPLYPDNREILIRIAKYSLWANDKKEAIRFANAVLKQHPSDEEAGDIRNKALLIHSYEAYAGYSYLDINDNVDGQNGYLGIRYKPDRGKTLYTQVDYLNRFDREEGRVMAGGAYPLSKTWGVSGEAAFSPDAEIYPIVSGRLEGIFSGISSLVLYGGVNGSHYQDADLYGLSGAAEYYFSGPFALFTRIGVSNTDFGEGDDSTDASFFLKLTWHATDLDSIFGYFAYGNEPYMNRTIDQIGKIEAKTYGIGARYFFCPNMGVAPRIEYQNRQRDTRYLEAALELLYRW